MIHTVYRLHGYSRIKFFPCLSFREFYTVVFILLRSLTFAASLFVLGKGLGVWAPLLAPLSSISHQAGNRIAELTIGCVALLGTLVLMSLGMGGTFTLTEFDGSGIVDSYQISSFFHRNTLKTMWCAKARGGQQARVLATQAWGSGFKCRVPPEKRQGVASYQQPQSCRADDRRIMGCVSHQPSLPMHTHKDVHRGNGGAKDTLKNQELIKVTEPRGNFHHFCQRVAKRL